jgi:hypothetical protein
MPRSTSAFMAACDRVARGATGRKAGSEPRGRRRRGISLQIRTQRSDAIATPEPRLYVVRNDLPAERRRQILGNRPQTFLLHRWLADISRGSVAVLSFLGCRGVFPSPARRPCLLYVLDWRGIASFATRAPRKRRCRAARTITNSRTGTRVGQHLSSRRHPGHRGLGRRCGSAPACDGAGWTPTCERPGFCHPHVLPHMQSGVGAGRPRKARKAEDAVTALVVARASESGRQVLRGSSFTGKIRSSSPLLSTAARSHANAK